MAFLKFKTRRGAVGMQKRMNKRYGYKPSIFKVRGKHKVRYVIVKPRGLKKI